LVESRDFSASGAFAVVVTSAIELMLKEGNVSNINFQHIAYRIEWIDLNDVIRPTAHTVIRGGKHFPWNAHAFIHKLEKRPPTSVVTKGFFGSSADDILLTGLTFADIIRDGKVFKVFEVFEKTQSKLRVYANAKKRLGSTGPDLVW
jgi:hypothetical protein